MGIGSVLGLAGNVAGSIFGSNAAGDAAKQQAAAIAKGQGALTDYYGKATTDLSPYMDAGTGALNKLQALLGIGSNANGGQTPGMLDTLASTPGYQFNLNQGLKAGQNRLTAMGLGGSGEAAAGASNYASGLAGNTYSTIAGLLQGLAGQGQGAATSLAGMGMQTGSGIANLYNTLGNDQAASTVAQGNIFSNLSNNIGGAYSGYNVLNRMGQLYPSTNNSTSATPNNAGPSVGTNSPWYNLSNLLTM